MFQITHERTSVYIPPPVVVCLLGLRLLVHRGGFNNWFLWRRSHIFQWKGPDKGSTNIFITLRPQNSYFFFFSIYLLIYLETAWSGDRERGREGESQAVSAPSAQSPTPGLNSWNVRLCPEPKPRVGHLADWATQAHPHPHPRTAPVRVITFYWISFQFFSICYRNIL